MLYATGTLPCDASHGYASVVRGTGGGFVVFGWRGFFFFRGFRFVVGRSASHGRRSLGVVGGLDGGFVLCVVVGKVVVSVVDVGRVVVVVDRVVVAGDGGVVSFIVIVVLSTCCGM